MRRRKRTKCVISPFNKLLIYWQLLQLIVIICWHLIFWERVAYGTRNPHIAKGQLRKIELVCDSLFLVDVILTFFTGVQSSEAKNMTWLRKSKHIDLDDDDDLGYVSNLRVIAMIYLRTTLIVDLIALFPFFTN